MYKQLWIICSSGYLEDFYQTFHSTEKSIQTDIISPGFKCSACKIRPAWQVSWFSPQSEQWGWVFKLIILPPMGKVETNLRPAYQELQIVKCWCNQGLSYKHYQSNIIMQKQLNNDRRPDTRLKCVTVCGKLHIQCCSLWSSYITSPKK